MLFLFIFKREEYLVTWRDTLMWADHLDPDLIRAFNDVVRQKLLEGMENQQDEQFEEQEQEQEHHHHHRQQFDSNKNHKELVC